MNTKGLVVIWLVGLISIFLLGLATAHIIYTLAMADFHQKRGTTTLEVKENYGTQHNQVYAEQPA